MEEQTLSLKRKKTCIICGADSSKYCCPSCNQYNCSLTCFKFHKKNSHCDLENKATKFVKKSEFEEKQFGKDIGFLNELMRKSEVIEKRLSVVSKGQKENMRYRMLVTYAEKLYGIKVVLMSPYLSRHRNNLSFFYKKDQQIFWVFEIQLHFCPNTIYKTTNPFSSSTKIQDIISSQDYFDSDALTIKGIDLSRDSITDKLKNREIVIYLENYVGAQKLSQELSRSLNQIIGVQSNPTKKRFLKEIHPNDNFSSICSNKVFMEYPTIHLLFKNNLSEFINSKGFEITN